jgi:hypothetical protein
MCLRGCWAATATPDGMRILVMHERSTPNAIGSSQATLQSLVRSFGLNLLKSFQAQMTCYNQETLDKHRCSARHASTGEHTHVHTHALKHQVFHPMHAGPLQLRPRCSTIVPTRSLFLTAVYGRARAGLSWVAQTTCREILRCPAADVFDGFASSMQGTCRTLVLHGLLKPQGSSQLTITKFNLTAFAKQQGCTGTSC